VEVEAGTCVVGTLGEVGNVSGGRTGLEGVTTSEARVVLLGEGAVVVVLVHSPMALVDHLVDDGGVAGSDGASGLLVGQLSPIFVAWNADEHTLVQGSTTSLESLAFALDLSSSDSQGVDVAVILRLAGIQPRSSVLSQHNLHASTQGVLSCSDVLSNSLNHLSNVHVITSNFSSFSPLYNRY
jgi:hypothetical protein